MERRKAFRKRLQEKGIIVAPGAYDAFSAKLIQHVGFEAVYATGSGISVGLLAEPDLGLVTMTEQVTQARNIVNAVDIPVICDADTGYGDIINVLRTVREFERTGVVAIHIEDQEMPKRCGHLEGIRVIGKEEMVQKLRAATEAREDEDFIIIARTDARSVYGLETALERGHAYIEAGADVLFLEAPETMEELKTIAQTFRGIPLLLNRGGKKTPTISVTEAEELGFKIVIFPGDLQRAAGKAMLDTLEVLKREGNTTSIEQNMLSFDERFELLGIQKYYDLEKRSLSSKESEAE